MKTTSRIEELKARHAAELAHLESEQVIAAMLPESVKLPTISNLSYKNEVHAWLSFSPEYGQDSKAFALSVFAELEKAGFEPIPASLCQWDNYRRSVSPGDAESIPSEIKDIGTRQKKLNDVEAIAPLWVVPCQFTGVEAKCFYRKDGKLFKVSVKIPMVAHLSCRRQEYRGGWCFEGPCTVHFPKTWQSIHTADGQSVASISKNTRGYRDTEQGISGAIYWQADVEQKGFPLTPAQMVAQLLA